MSNGGKEREAHVKRIFRLNDDGTVDEDVWLDVLRIDKLTVTFTTMNNTNGLQYQDIKSGYKWNDDPSLPVPGQGVDASKADAQFENANAARETEQLTIKNPDDPTDDTQQIKLWLVNKLWIRQSGDASNVYGQNILLAFDNTSPADPDYDENHSKRTTTVIKVSNNDLHGLDLKPKQTIGWDDYAIALATGTTDDSQHLDVEVTDHYWQQWWSNNQSGLRSQNLVVSLTENEQVEMMFKPGNPKAVDADGFPSVLRTDPLQTIVNVQFGGLAVEFFDGAGPPAPAKP